METYRELAGRIRDLPPTLGPCRLIAVDGPSGAGKSRFAGRLAAALAAVGPAAEPPAAEPPAAEPPAAEPPVVRTDDLLDGWADQLTFWPRLREWVLDPLRAGRPGRYRRYDWARQRFNPNWIPVPVSPVVIVEGVSSARAAIAAELTLAVFVTAPAAARLDRVVARDGAAVLPALETWRRGEDAHFAADRTADRADLLVDGAPGRPYDPDSQYLRLFA
nr:hypothetical protein [Micromonospora sp. DSM 115978]